MRLLSLFAVCALSTVAIAQTVDDVKADIANLLTLATQLDNAVVDLPTAGATLASALAIHNAAGTLKTALDGATSDVEATPTIPESDMEDMLPSLQQLCSIIEDILQILVQKKPALDSIPLGGVSGLVKQDIANLRVSFYAFLNALGIQASPPVQPLILGLRDQLDATFATTQAAYP